MRCSTARVFRRGGTAALPSGAVAASALPLPSSGAARPPGYPPRAWHQDGVDRFRQALGEVRLLAKSHPPAHSSQRDEEITPPSVVEVCAKPEVEPVNETPKARQPLPTAHPAFGQQQLEIDPQPSRPMLSTAHPAFGSARWVPPRDLFDGPVSVSGFFFAIDPSLCFGTHFRMNPNAQLTINDQSGGYSRVRYRCQLKAGGGVKVEALMRCQMGWISPRATFTKVPEVINIGRGFDISVPYLFHFTMASVLDEHGCATGSNLYLSGTPMLGFSAGISRIEGGRLVMHQARKIDPSRDTKKFVGKRLSYRLHYRQLSFVVAKLLGWAICCCACHPWFQDLSAPVQGALLDTIPAHHRETLRQLAAGANRTYDSLKACTWSA